MSERGIRFLTPDVATEVTLAELEALRAELERIADGAPRLAAAAALAGRLEKLVAPLERGSMFEPSPEDRYALLRATDHLRNLGHGGELMTLRARLVRSGDVHWIAYRLRFLDTRPPQEFTSYSLAYEPGDRLVTATAEERRVLELSEGDPTELLVDHWQPAE